jgi:hypothetical protein
MFSRKGVDSAAGGGASPIVGGRPVSLPIPSGGYSQTSYGDLGLGAHVEKASRGKLGGDDLCHHDPMFVEGEICHFGQCSAAQTHLQNRRVRQGDVFLFFGLFRDEATGEPHHRIFGYLEIAEINKLSNGSPRSLTDIGHPHALGMHGSNDCIYSGPGMTARRASEELRLTVEGGPPSLWKRPVWLKPGGLSYHDRTDRWLRGGKLKSVARGQEFVANIGRRKAPREWLARIIDEIRAS